MHKTLEAPPHGGASSVLLVQSCIVDGCFTLDLRKNLGRWAKRGVMRPITAHVVDGYWSIK